jgi:ribosome-associated translation inhibitor RaiA|tara:strand:- start:149 stop:400 length:252 start_codon:yes stop_codon:yes gene_type:complete
MLDKRKLKDLKNFCEYAENLQILVAWLIQYYDIHAKLNVTQHDWVTLETAKETGVDIKMLLQKHKLLIEQYNEELYSSINGSK